MNRKLGLLAILGLAACSRNAPAPVAPVATAPAAEQPQTAPNVAAAPQKPATDSQPIVVTAPQELAPRVQVTDTVRDQAFLDSLRVMRADTTAPAPAVVQVAPSEVRQEAASLFGRPEGAAASATWDIDVESYASHDRVKAWMTFFTGRSRWHFERYIERAGRYDSMIRTRLAAAGMPQDMIYLAMIESGFAQNIRSRAGAVGVWQFMPSTGRRYGLAVDAWVDERRDPYLATDAAIRFLTELNNRFGSWYLAAAAYNAGPGRVQRGLARGDYGALNGNDAYFAMAEGTSLRRETRDYVPKLIAAALLAKQPERYGFVGLEPWEPLTYDSVTITYAVGLDVVARLAGSSREEIEELNPALIRGVTPPDRTSWLKLPFGTGPGVAARLAVLPAADRVTVVVHFVERGETLSGLSQRYHVSVADIRSANRMSSSRLSRGQRLVIPTSSSRVRSQGGRVPNDPVRYSTRATSPSRSASASRTATVTRTSPRGTTSTRRVHVVKAGENPYAIAAAFHVSLDDLLRVNGLSRRSVIHVGQSIRIPN